jgi:hypothetical protein
MNANAARQNSHWPDVNRRALPRISAIAAAALWVFPALAQAPMAPPAQQAPAWPSDSQPQAAPGAPAWPGGGGAPQAQPMGAPPRMSAPASGFGPPPGMGGGGGMAQPGGGQEACANEFTRLRGEVDKHGKVAKGISERKGSREELCKAITGLFGAESKWVKYAKDNASVCGIPPDIIKQLGAGHDNLSKMRTQVCSSGGPGAAQAPRPPSLSEALGTSRLPTQDNTTVKRGGTLDTLTGNPIR